MGSEVGGLVVKSEIFITMGMWEKITFILKKKNFSFLRVNRRKMGGMWGWGGNRLNYGKKNIEIEM